MPKLEISDDLKYGKEEILLNPSKKGNKCGSETTALTFNDLFIGLEGKDTIKALQYISDLIDSKIANYHANDNNGNGNGNDNQIAIQPITIIYE